MKFLDIFGLILLSVLMLVIGMSIMQGAAWTATMKGSAFWFTQAFAYSLAIVAATCAITQKKIKDLNNITVGWISGIVLVVALIGIALMKGSEKGFMMNSFFELILFFGILLSLFLIPRYNR